MTALSARSSPKIKSAINTCVSQWKQSKMVAAFSNTGERPILKLSPDYRVNEMFDREEYTLETLFDENFERGRLKPCFPGSQTFITENSWLQSATTLSC